MMSKIIIYLLCALLIFLSYKKNPQQFKASWSLGLERRKNSKTYRNFAIVLLIFVLLCVMIRAFYILQGATTYLSILWFIATVYLMILIFYAIYMFFKAVKQKNLKTNTAQPINYRLYDFVYIFLFVLQYYLIYNK